jgi:hypothetical protein
VTSDDAPPPADPPLRDSGIDGEAAVGSNGRPAAPGAEELDEERAAAAVTAHRIRDLRKTTGRLGEQVED